MASLRTLSHGMPNLNQPGARYHVHDSGHRGCVVGFWDTDHHQPTFQVRATRMEPPVAHELIRAAVAARPAARPLRIHGRRGGAWARDERLYRPERPATFCVDGDGRYRLYTRHLTAAELTVVLWATTSAIRRHRAVQTINNTSLHARTATW
ncbi:hypothetical protein ACH4VR_36105 [Streptomyces sp. NPDC020883]|uniref:hypothetical protein n=1 Tax=Streptomyces sp. NPDC020883 TaxID=3365099 RepID=UPI0037BD9AC3